MYCCWMMFTCKASLPPISGSRSVFIFAFHHSHEVKRLPDIHFFAQGVHSGDRICIQFPPQINPQHSELLLTATIAVAEVS